MPPSLNVVLAAIATMGQNLLGSDDEVDDTPTQGGYDDVGGSFDQVGCSSSYSLFFFNV